MHPARALSLSAAQSRLRVRGARGQVERDLPARSKGARIGRDCSGVWSTYREGTSIMSPNSPPQLRECCPLSCLRSSAGARAVPRPAVVGSRRHSRRRRRRASVSSDAAPAAPRIVRGDAPS